MSVQTQIDRISGAVSAALTALAEKGVTVPAGTKVDGLAALIAAIEAGGGSGGIGVSFFDGMKFEEGSVTYSSDTWPDNMILTNFNQCYGGIVIADSEVFSGSYVYLGVYVADSTRGIRPSVAGAQGSASFVSVSGMDGYYKANSFCLSASVKYKAGVTYKYVVWGV